MNNPNEKSLFIEDGFDLEELKSRARGLKRKNALLRKYKKVSKLLIAISCILVLSAVFSAGWVINYYSEAKKAEQINEKVLEISGVGLDHQMLTINEDTATPPVIDDTEETAPFQVGDGEEAVIPVTEEDRAVLDKIANLREAFSNEDIVGYLQIDNTNISYAVAQSNDNEFYLRRDLNGEKSSAGSVFMDYECDAYNLSRNTVIYGHNMRNGSMFHNLRYFTDPEYFAERRFIRLTTPHEETLWEIFAFYETDTDFYYIQVVFPNDESFLSLVSEMKEKSIYDTGIEVGSDDRILTLSTCANTASEARFVLNARLVGD